MSEYDYTWTVVDVCEVVSPPEGWEVIGLTPVHGGLSLLVWLRRPTGHGVTTATFYVDSERSSAGW